MLCGVFSWYEDGKYWILLDEPGWEILENYDDTERLWYAPIEDEI
jgi:hypothetical protein